MIVWVQDLDKYNVWWENIWEGLSDQESKIEQAVGIIDAFGNPRTLFVGTQQDTILPANANKNIWTKKQKQKSLPDQKTVVILDILGKEKRVKIKQICSCTRWNLSLEG